jgi:hypothetical protein
MTCLPTHCPGRKASERERPWTSGLSRFLLAWTVPLWFCAGLVGLAAAPALGVVVPRWTILACGAGCVLWALLLGRPARQDRKGTTGGSDLDNRAS